MKLPVALNILQRRPTSTSIGLASRPPSRLQTRPSPARRYPWHPSRTLHSAGPSSNSISAIRDDVRVTPAPMSSIGLVRQRNVRVFQRIINRKGRRWRLVYGTIDGRNCGCIGCIGKRVEIIENGITIDDPISNSRTYRCQK
jgi:hypothetical protein